MVFIPRRIGALVTFVRANLRTDGFLAPAHLANAIMVSTGPTLLRSPRQAYPNLEA